MSRTHYDTLGVSPTATAEEIKRARLRLIRLHPPETSPEVFKTINMAYQTLSDPTTRREYDVERLYGPEIEALMAEASRLRDEGKPAEAIRRLKRVLVLDSEAKWGWNLLGICFTQAQKWDQARKAYTRLVERHPDSALFRMNFAYVAINEAEEVPVERMVEKRRLAAESRSHLKQALRLEPDNLTVHRAVVRSHTVEHDFAGAVAAMEEVIAADKGGPNSDDYLFLARLYRLADDTDEVEGVAARLAFALAGNAEGLRGASAVFARFAVEMFEDHNFAAAHDFIRAAALIDPECEATRGIKTTWDAAQAASDEYDRMKEDPLVIPPVRFLMAIYTDEARNLPLSSPRDELLEKVSDALPTYAADEIVSAAYRIRTRYPAIYRLQPDVLDRFESGD
jgi:tetratricopeptide (TPR) repeat protein